MSIRTYSELISLSTFEERYDYLRIGGRIGEETFGHNRYLNQILYHQPRWNETRMRIIARDEGFDLAYCNKNFEIFGFIVVHHMNPITIEDVINDSEFVWNDEFLISTSDGTHRAIHYGQRISLPKYFIERRPNDTCPWR